MQHVDHVRTHDLAHLVQAQILGMLGGDHNRGRADGLAVFVAQRDLAFGIRSQARLRAGMARLSQRLQNAMGKVDGRRHQLIGLGAGITEHNALVARTLVLVAGRVHALGDIGGLGVQVDGHVSVFPVKAILLVADVLHSGARDLFDMGLIDFTFGAHQRRGTAHFARNDNAVGCGQCLAGHTRLWIGGQESIDDGVGYPVANFIWVSLRDGFTGEKETTLSQGALPWF